MKQVLKRFAISLGVLLLVVVGIILFRAYSVDSLQPNVVAADYSDINVPKAAVDRFSEAIRIPTISLMDSAARNNKAFREFHTFLEKSYPEVHNVLNKRIIGRHALLYEWPGEQSELDPLVLMAHIDVVPIEPGTENLWKHPPFSGVVDSGYVWGRGTVDDKESVMAILEAVEMLIGEGYRPKRTIMLSFGDDEETYGTGAELIAETLAAEGIHPWMVMDEGGSVLDNAPLPVNHPVALVGTGEKGYLSIELIVQSEGGHSSAPPNETAVGVLASALYNLQQSPFPIRPKAGTKQTFDYLTPEMSFSNRLIFANRWLFQPLVTRTLSATPETNAMLRTTIAPTMLTGSPQDNVLAAEARAIVNHRIIPGESIESVLKHVRSAINDERVQIKALDIGKSEPSPLSPLKGDQWNTLSSSILKVFPDAIISPFLGIGATDSRFMSKVSDHIYRFSPYRSDFNEPSGAHGDNEKVKISSFKEGILFFRQFIMDSTGG